MTATLSMVPLAKIKPSNGDNPRSEFADEQMAELVASIKRHGIITPLMLAPDGADGFTIIAGERRYRAAKAAKLRQVPAQVRDADGEALTLAVAENVIRADLSPIEEARAYRRLADEHGGAAKVARLVGKSERLVAERLDLLRLPEATQELLAARRLPLACAPPLVRIAEARAAARRADGRLARRATELRGRLPVRSGRVRGRCAASRPAGEGARRGSPVAYSVTEFGSGPILPTSVHDEDAVAAVLAKLGGHAEPVAAALAELPEIAHASDHDWSARQAEGRRWRECFALTDADADAARAFGCLLELSGRNGRSHAYVTDPEWLADRLAEKIATHATAATERKSRENEERTPGNIGGRSREGSAAAGAPAAVRGTRVRPRAQPRSRRGAREVAAEARRRRRQAPWLDRPAAARQGGGMGAPALRRAALDGEQAGQGERALPARRGGRAEAPRRGDRRSQTRPYSRGRTRGRPAPAHRSATGRHCRPAQRRPPGRLRAAGAGHVAHARQARSPGRPGLGQAATWPRRRPSESSASRRGATSRRRGFSSSATSSPLASPSAASAASARSSPPPTRPRSTARSIHSGDCEQQWGSATDEDEEAAA